MPRYLTEFVGTFFLVLTIGLTVVAGLPAAPLAIGLTLTALVYMGGHVSGAHYNPAVTVALLLRGTVARGQVPGYLAAQLLGAGAAATVVPAMTGVSWAPAPAATATLGAVVAAEFLFTYLLVLVILHVATSPDTAGNSYYGLAIGLTVTGGAYAVGGISGAAFNPAVGAGPIVVRALVADGSLADLWVYLVVPVAGALAAVATYRTQTPAAGVIPGP